MSMLNAKDPVYDDGMTKQSFKDQCDINKILKKAQRTGSLAHVQKYPEAVYGEFTGVDLLGAHEQNERARAIFEDLPSEVRKDFNNNHFDFIAFASDPKNVGKLVEILPAIAEPGRYFPNPVQRFGNAAAAATAPAAEAPQGDSPREESAEAAQEPPTSA